MKVLQLSVHLFPNVGGVETHLSDLFRSLIEKKWQVFVLAYQPLSTKTNWKIWEKEKNLTILRIPWIRGFFEKLVHLPVVEFIYLVPGLFLLTPLVIFFFKPKVLHTHGLSAAVAGVFWGKLFKTRTVISLHSIYTFPPRGLYHDFVKLLFKNADFILSLSKKSNTEVRALGIEDSKTYVFTYWINLERFKKISNAKQKKGLQNKFIVLFVGRLIKEKGIDELLKSSQFLNNKINLLIAGSGPMDKEIERFSNQKSNVHFIGKIDQSDLPLYYSAADCVIVPSTSEEGFGRVIIESLACGTPVVASNRGAISEAMDNTVGILIEPTVENIKQTIEYFYNNPQQLKKLSDNTRKFAERRYSKANVDTIIKAYTG